MCVHFFAMQVGRKDAIRNRSELLAAAEAAVAEHGVDVAFNLIAKAAGVGQGTLYRHFPDRDALLQALLEQSLDNLEVAASQQTGDDGLLRVLEYYADNIDRHAALATYWRVVDPGHPGIMAGRQRFSTLMEPLLQRAIKAGLCRDDVTFVDIRSIIAMLTVLPSRGGQQRSLSEPRRMLAWLVSGIWRS